MPDTARKRIGLPPFLLGEAALAAITERGRTDLAEALAGLPESQRIAVYRRVLGDDEYAPAPASIGVSELVKRDPETRKARDPFDLLGERLFVAAGGRVEHSRRTLLAVATVLVVLFGAGLAVAALRLSDDDEAPNPTPTPTETPTAAPPDPTATPTPRPGNPRARPGPGRPPGPTAPPCPRPRSTSSSSRTCVPGASAGAWTCRSSPEGWPTAIAAAHPPARPARWSSPPAAWPGPRARATRSSTRR